MSDNGLLGHAQALLRDNARLRSELHELTGEDSFPAVDVRLFGPGGESIREVRTKLRELRKQNRDMERAVSDARVAKRDRRVRAFVQDNGLDERLIELIGDRDPAEFWAEYRDVIEGKTTTS